MQKDNNWAPARSLIQHARPSRVPAAALRFTLTFGLGGMAMVLFLVLLFTGTLMVFVYEPSPDRAYKSILYMQDENLFGRLVRGGHYWGANLLIAVSALHLVRVFLTGAFHGKRRANWMIGLGMLFVILVSGFTGYLLPWDQISYWAITICTEMLGYIPLVGESLQQLILGGTDIGAATMLNFYAMHTVIAPLLLVFLMTWHFWRVRVAGGVVGPQEDFVPYQPNLAQREKTLALIVIAVVIVLAIIFGAPLDQPANPGVSPNPAKAAWYFIGLQELLLHFHPLFAVLIIPLFAIVGIIGVTYLQLDASVAGNWFLTRNGRRTSAVAAIVAILLAVAWILADESGVGPRSWLPDSAPLIRDGLLPCAILVCGVIGFYMLIKKYFAASKTEAVQALFVLFAVGFAVFMVTGTWFRGAGMALMWPWQI